MNEIKQLWNLRAVYVFAFRHSRVSIIYFLYNLFLYINPSHRPGLKSQLFESIFVLILAFYTRPPYKLLLCQISFSSVHIIFGTGVPNVYFEI